jgi:hypothetical protein
MNSRVFRAFGALAFVCLSASAATVRIEQIGPTVAHAYISGFTGSCTWNLYPGTAASGSAHPDVTASVDTSRPDIVTTRTGVRIMRLGHDEGNNALAVNTDYTLATDGSDTGCASTSPVTFHTYFQPPPVNTRMPIPKWTPNTYTNASTPTYDWTNAGRGKWYTAPFTGTEFSFFEQAGVQRWSTFSNSYQFVVAGGTGWTNLQNAGSGSVSTYATTTNGNPAVLLPYTLKDFFRPLVNHRGTYDLTYPYTLDNIGVIPFGNCTGTSGTNCQVQLCWSFNSTAANPTCQGSPVVITLGTGSVAQIASSSTDSDHPFPNAYPDSGWGGWGNLVIPKDRQPQEAIVTAVCNGVVYGSSGGWTDRIFGPTAKDNYIVIPNSVGSWIWAVESVQGNQQLTLVDKTLNLDCPSSTGQITGSGYIFGAGLVAKRVTATAGTVNFGVKFKAVGHAEDDQDTPSYPMCGTASITYNGNAGRLCFSKMAQRALLYFVSDDSKDVHPVMQPADLNIGYGTSHTMASAADYPGSPFVPPLAFDTALGNVFYVGAQCNSGQSTCIYKVTVRDLAPQYTALGDILYKNDLGVDDDHRAGVATAGNALIENLTPPSQNKDLDYVIAHDSTYAWATQGIYSHFMYTTAKWQLLGSSGQLMFFYKQPSEAGQDNWPLLYAAVRLGDPPAVMRVFSTHYNGESTNIPEMRWGAHHAHIVEPAIPNTMSMTVEYPGNNFGSYGWGVLGSRIVVKPLGVMRSGSWSSDTSLAGYPYSGYDQSCPSDMPNFVLDRVSSMSTQCVTMKLSTNICWEAQPIGRPPSYTAAQSILYGSPACGWNSSFTKSPWTFLVGDRMTPASCQSAGCGFWTGNDHMMLGKILPGSPTGELWGVFLRDSGWDYECLAPLKGSAPNNCQHGADFNIPNGWYGSLVAGRNETKGASGYKVQIDPNDGSYRIAEDFSKATAHGADGFGLVPGTVTTVATDISSVNMTLDKFGAKSGESLPKANTITRPGGSFPFAGAVSNSQQNYLNRSQLPGFASQWTADTNHLNDSNNGGPIGNPRNFVSIANCTDVYKINPMAGGYSYKTAPLFGYSGHHILEDVSGPNVNICSAHDYAMVYVQRAGDQVGITNAGNSYTPQVGDIFVKVPSADLSGSGSGCPTRQPWRNDTCVLFAATSNTGGYRRFWSEHDDVDRKLSQTLMTQTPGFPGSHYFFGTSYVNPTGQSMFGLMGFVIDGHRNAPLLMKLPPFRPNYRLNTFLVNGAASNSSIHVPPAVGATHARIKFGFDPNTFYCSGRAEACVTDASMNSLTNPFAYVGEAANPHSCSTGCDIPTPFDLGRGIWYQIEYLSGGAVVQTSDVTPIVVN